MLDVLFMWKTLIHVYGKLELELWSALSTTMWSVFSELAMLLSLAQTNPAMFGMVTDSPGVAQQLELMGRLKELLETDQDELKRKQRGDWIHWVSRYRYDEKEAFIKSVRCRTENTDPFFLQSGCWRVPGHSLCHHSVIFLFWVKMLGDV